MAIDENSTIFKNLSHRLDVKNAQKQIDEAKQNVDRIAYDVYDSGGSKIGGAMLKPGESISQGEKVYVNKQTGEVAKNIDDAFRTPEIKAFATLDKNTGSIKVSAPSLANKSEAFKANYDSILKTISQNYRKGSDYKYALLDGDKTKTSEEWLEDINKDMQETAELIYKRDRMRKSVKEQSGLTLTDEQLAKMGAIALEYSDDTGQVIKVSDDTIQALPERIKNMNVFKNLEGWDEDTHTVRYDNLMKAWNRGEVWEKGASDQDFLDVFSEVERYFAEGNFTDADEYAEMYALQQFILGKNPDAGFFQKYIDLNVAGGMALLTGGATFTAGALNLAEAASPIGMIEMIEENIFKTNKVKDAMGAVSYELTKNLPGGGTTALRGDFVDQYLLPELDAWKDGFRKNQSALNKLAGAEYTIADTVTPIIMQMSVGNAMGQAVAATAGNAIAEAMATNEVFNKPVIAGIKDILLAAGESVKGGESALKIAESTYAGTKAYLTFAGAAKANAAVSGAINALKAAKASSKLVRGISTFADLAAQTTIDVAMTDSHIFRQFLSGEGSPEDKAYIVEQIVGNYGGWAAFAVGGKAFTKFAGTELGRVMNASLSKNAARLSNLLGDRADDIRRILHGGDKDWAMKKAKSLDEALKTSKDKGNAFQNKVRAAYIKAYSQEENRLVREAKKKAIKEAGDIIGESWKDTVKNADKFQMTMLDKIMSAEEVVEDAFRQNFSDEVAKIVSKNPDLNSVRSEHMVKLQKVLQAEDAEGIIRSGKKFELGKEAMSSLASGKDSKLNKIIEATSKETNDYILAKYRLNIAQNTKAITTDGNRLKRIEEEISRCNEIVEDYVANHSQELVDAANELESVAKKFSAAIEDARVAERVMDAEELAEMRNSPTFKDGYMRTQRVDSWKKYVEGGGTSKRAEIRGDQDIDWGSDKEWQDVTAVLFEDLNQLGKQVVRRRLINNLKNIGEVVEVEVGADAIKMVKKIDPIKDQATKNIAHQIKKFSSEQLDSSFFEDVVSKKMTARTAINIAEDATQASGARVAKAASSDIKIPIRERRALINDLDGGYLDDILADNGGNPFAFEITNDAEFDEFLNKMDRTTSDLIKTSMRDQIGYLYDSPKSAQKAMMEQLADMPKYNAAAWRRQTGEKIPSWAKSFVTKEGGKELEDLTVVDELKKQWDMIKAADTKAPSLYTLENFNKMVANDPDLIPSFKKSYAGHNKDVLEDKRILGFLQEQKREQRVFELNTIFKDNQKKLEALKKRYNLDDIEEDLVAEFNEIVDGVIDSAEKDAVLAKAVAALNEGDDALEYVVLKEMKQQMNKKKGQGLRASYSRVAQKKYNEILTNRGKLDKEKIPGLANKWASETADWFEEQVMNRFSQVEAKMVERGSSLVDYDDYFGRVDELNKEISAAEKATDIVKTFDDNGVEEYVRLSPTIASMVTTMPPALQRGTYGKIQNAFCKMFRMGTTGGLVPGSLMRQAFKDTGNAVVVGNALRGTEDIENLLVKNFGDNIAETFANEMPDLWSQLLGKADGDIQKATRMAVRSEFERGAMNVGSELESNQYDFSAATRYARNADGVYEESVFTKMKDGLDKAYQKTEALNNMREQFLRNRVYQNGIYNAMQNYGMSFQNARRYAEFMQREATTNFGRMSYHFANMSKTVPYLGAAINGTKSFWKLYALDPVGVTTRIIGGYIVPMMALTNLSLSNEEDRRIYEQIPEWQKDGQLTLVVQGQIFQIPVPEEISKVIRPIQTMLEKMRGVNEKDFNELMLNDLLGFSPINLQGFVNIDRDRLLKEDVENTLDATVQSHLIPGVSRLVSGMLPPITKSAVMALTGYDPYTMKKIDRSKTSTDQEAGEKIVVDYQSGELAKFIAKITNGTVSAPMAQMFLKNLIGENNTYIADAVGGLMASVVDEDKTAGSVIGEFAERELGDALETFTPKRYGELSNQAWNRAVRKLYEKKEKLEKETADDVAALKRGFLSEKAENEIRARLNQKRDAYRQEVLAVVQNLNTQYDGTYDRNKFLSTISLLNFADKDSGSVDDNPMVSRDNINIYNDAKAAAIQTMQSMGFTSSNDYSVLGYYKENTDGSITLEYNNPLSILNFNKTQNYQDRYHLSAIQEIATKKDENGLTWYDRHKELSDRLDPLYAAKDYDKIEELQIEWDNQIMKELAPYIAQMGPTAAIGNKKVLDYLSSYIEVPSSFEKNGNRFVSLGKYGTKKSAYVDSWIKGMFGIKDEYKGDFSELNKQLKEKYGLRDYNE